MNKQIVALPNTLREGLLKFGALISVIVLASALCLASGCASDSSESSSAGPGSDAVNDIAINVFLTASGIQNPDEETVSFEDVQINVIVPADSSALDVLEATGRDIVVEGSGDNAKVIGIDGLQNGAAGQGSEWTYEVNGTPQTVSPAVYEISKNDTLTWKFSN